MLRKILALLFVVMMVLVLPQVVFADTDITSAVFINADTNQAIYEIGTVKNVKAKLRFSSKEGNINIIMAGYDADDRLVTNVVWETTTVTAENKDSVIHTMKNSISADGVNTIKLFAWEELTLSPVLKPNGVLNKAFVADEGYAQKLTAADGITQENPLVVVKGNPVFASDIFETVDGAQVNSEFFNVSGTSLDSTAVDMDFAANALDWRNATLTFNATGLIKLTAFDYDFCIPSYSYVRVIEPVDRYYTKFENTDDYLYRVGNKNAVSLSSLFAANESIVPISDMKVEIATKKGNANGTFTPNESDWTKGTIKFSGTGVVSVTIQDSYSNPTSLLLEVVDAKNITTYSELTTASCVLLNNIEMAKDEKHSFSNATLFGNGFIFDVTKGGISGENMDANYLVKLSNSSLDNVKIVGKVYTQYGEEAKTDYNRPVVLSVGNSTISNSYIANCAAPVRVNGGNIEIINTTLKGGVFANVDIRNGQVVLDNITTINQVSGNDTSENGTVVVGLGVVVYREQVLNTTTIEIKNGITQYNHLSKSQSDKYINNENAKTLTNAMFSSSYSSLQYKDGSDTWVNTGIISMTGEVGDANITDIEGYSKATPTVLGTKGFVHTRRPDAASISAAVPDYVTAGQYAIAPTYSFEYPTNSSKSNYIAKEEGSNKYCYYSNGTIFVSFDEGDSVSFDTSIFTATKAGQALDYSVTMNGGDYTGKTIIFEEPGDYTLTYTYTDNNNYNIDESRNISTYPKTYTKKVFINVSEVKPDAKKAEFNFVSTGAATKTVLIGNDTYVMPDVTATSDKIGSTTVSDTTIYYPIIEAYTDNGKTTQTSGTNWHMCFPVFNNVITIIDYAEGGTGDVITYNGATTELPSGLEAVSPGTTFQYSSANSAPDKPTIKNNILVYTSPEMEGVNRNAMSVLAKYKYQDNSGAVYYYYVCYRCPAIKNNACLIPGTHITMADGTQKAIEDITYEDELLVWNFYEGKYDKSKAAIIFNHGTCDNTVIDLMFEDGTAVSIVNLHQFFDADENKYVNVAADTVEALVGHRFVKIGENGYSAVKLVEYNIRQENTGAYGIISSGHYNIIAEGMLTTDFETQDTGLFNYFDVGEKLTYKNVNQDVERYGLYTYKEFESYLTPELFDAFNVKYMKVAVGKGQFTYEGILGLIEKWLTNNNDF